MQVYIHGSTLPTSPKLTWVHRECSSWFRIMSDEALQPSRACQSTLKPCLLVLTFTPFWRIGIGKEPYDFELNQSLKSGSNVISGLLNLQNKNVNIKDACTVFLESEHFNVAVTLHIISVPELPLATRALIVHTELCKIHPFLFPLSKKSHKYSLQKLEKTYKTQPMGKPGVAVHASTWEGIRGYKFNISLVYIAMSKSQGGVGWVPGQTWDNWTAK